MRIGFLMAFGLIGLALVGSLVNHSRLSARDVTIPAELPSQLGKSRSSGMEQSTDDTSLFVQKVPTMIVNTRRIKLNYSVSDVGPSGVAAIELWATRDGRAWQRYSNEPPPAGPLVVHVAEEGRYGFSIVVRSGTGLKSSAPKSGDAPQIWVEVDETKPAVKIKDVQLGTGGDSRTLYVHYEASDLHLTTQPVSIAMATKKDGPWTTIASGLENTGVFGWQFPKDLPYQFYVRVEAEDRAGNVGSVVTAEPIKIDLARPRGTILGVDADKKQSTPNRNRPVEGFFIGYEQ